MQITILRILLIPVFIGLAVYYAQSVKAGAADESLRLWTVVVFAVAALSDALDGWVARRFDMRTRLVAILDPLADKLLLLSAILTLSFTSWRQQFPLWFPLLIVFKDLASIGAAFIIDHFAGKCHIQAHWTGKACTVAQIVAVLWIMLDITTPALIWPVLITAFFALWSGVYYLVDGTRQLLAAEPK
ncbi:MAG: CDP-alcohol phosphatidyltransferase family protein [Verrucomicrobiaceae bacterium]|nr:CDP-alcohol phosphatidyltransferase family protein [Verrucomicrobiaceae bacterium]